MGMNSPADIAHKIISSNRYMTLATCGVNDLLRPGCWVSAVAYVRDREANFYWYSAIDAIHSINIAKNPDLAITIFNSTEPSDIVDGVQFACTACEVAPEMLDDIMNLYFTQSFPDPKDREPWLRPRTDFQGEAIQRFYIATINRAYKINLDIQKIDKRLEIDVEQIRERFRSDP
jgi:uncharacterized protein YhbP (UPF0306 family)